MVVDDVGVREPNAAFHQHRARPRQRLSGLPRPAVGHEHCGLHPCLVPQNARTQTPEGSKEGSRRGVRIVVGRKFPPKRYGRVAQWESTTLTLWGSEVQSFSCPPSRRPWIDRSTAFPYAVPTARKRCAGTHDRTLVRSWVRYLPREGWVSAWTRARNRT